MPAKLLEAILGHLPQGMQFAVRRANFSRRISRGTFLPDEPEIADVTEYARSGDWVVDVGANIGRYTCYMSRCVGPSGRVLAFEPIAESFALLASNVRASGATNVSLFNIGLSSSTSVLRMAVPRDQGTHMNNYYQAQISAEGEFRVLCLPLDAIPIPERVRLIKIDAEGHDVQVLQGAEALIGRDRPLLIVEGWESGAVAAWLREHRYSIQKRPNSANMVARPLEWE
jgi:FkbM family methyltransferase